MLPLPLLLVLSAQDALADGLSDAITKASQNPALLGELATIDEDVASAMASVSPGLPFVDLRIKDGTVLGTDEGKGSHGLRVGVPFRYPWQWPVGSDLVRQASLSGDLAGQAVRLALAGEVASAWIEAAALQARLDDARRQGEQADQILATEEERVSGGLVPPLQLTRLRMERVRISSRVRSLEVDAVARVGEISRLCGDSVAGPGADELGVLVGATRSPTEDMARIEDGLAFRILAADAERERLVGEVQALDAQGAPRIEFGIQQDPGWDFAHLPYQGTLALRIPVPVGRQASAGRAEGEAHATAAARLAEGGAADLTARLRADLESARVCEAWTRDLEPALSAIPEAEHTLSEQYRLRDIDGYDIVNDFDQLGRPRADLIEAERCLLQARLDMAILLHDPELFPALRVALAEPGAIE